LAAQASQGKTIIDGGFIRTLLIHADAIVTEALVTKYIDAAYIAARVLKVGNFTIATGWLKSTATAGEDVGYIDMTTPTSRIAFGNDLRSADTWWTCTAIIKNHKIQGGETRGLEIDVAGSRSSGCKPVALIANGDIRVKGAVSFVEKVCPLESASFQHNSALILSWYNTFVLQPTSTSYYYLPNAAAIVDVFGYFGDGYHTVDNSIILIKIIVTRWATASAIFYGDPSTPIVNNQGNGIPNVVLSKGNVLELGYHNRAWYIFNLRQ
jgi:hypothetical protein